MRMKFMAVLLMVVALFAGCQEKYIIVPAFEIKVDLDERAERELREKKETINVSVLISGIPRKDSGIKENNKAFGLILDSAERELDRPGIVRFEGLKIPENLYEALENKHYFVSVSIRSGWKSSKFNLLNCEPLEKGISGVAGKQHVIKCKLIRDSE